MKLANRLIWIIPFLVLSLVSCSHTPLTAQSASTHTIPANLLSTLSASEGERLRWMNMPDVVSFEKGILSVNTAPGTDFFIDPENGSSSASAPFLFYEANGDFVATAVVEPDFSSTWNAVSVMVMLDAVNWIKFAFEYSDATGKSIVSVVTKSLSDDANGVRLPDTDKVWLRVIRKGDLYSMFWSVNGEQFYMARLTRMKSQAIVKVGVEAQSPLKQAATHKIHYFGVEPKTVTNLRTGL
ncbi:DUF1349 domain-containing protein [Alteromonas lipolytica]|uniref:DUF1349 domain-containing protein n=1 Tax=Alteromonas lipolytica TaxID=1856405 RepID=A0A1E8FDW0_9ALTE|nr:DUF1349 domain-containing protein [Alteromonas lipolytica]OFI34110.1 hypothetical protein BFC17_21435 [Alteromonas lipolytica]GGF65299.1 hypothetical protein GCM10011338_17090 [Alteromonas lipolytica]